ncbi:tRNA-dihydrouridine synthase [Nocardioides pantholopis]|uniref:tRNA-dihydrouridine synthase n=1 Tax=Nocardioides pantholopis TaxID=2483798 RepID=UPI000F087807|nr:tRNA-dihydrouridine synthase [Nocardioides pantholopis]
MSGPLHWPPSGRAIPDLALRSPVLVAAGCGGTGRELAAYAGLDGVGGFVTRSISLDPRPGAPVPRLLETPSGLLHATGHPNPGLEPFLATELPPLVQSGVRVVVSVVASSLQEYAELARRLGNAPGIAALEVDLGAPDAAAQGLLEAREPATAADVVAAVAGALPRGLPVLAKLRPDLARVVETARAVAGAGAGAVVVGSAQPAAMPDGRPAGLSGPAVRPLALRCVTELHAALPDLPVLGAGGITTTADARSFLAAGATAVQIGTALLHDPTTAARIAADLTADQAADNPEETAR